MLNEYFEVLHQASLAKQANRQRVADLKKLPLDDLKKIAMYGCTSPYSSAPEGWLERYKGTPLLARALEIERQALEVEAQELERRETEEASSLQRRDLWTERDKLNLQRRVLDLDLAALGSSAPAEAKEDQALAMLEAAQAEEGAAAPDAPVHEKQENAGIQQIRAAQATEKNEEKTAGAVGTDTRRVSLGVLADTIHPDRQQGAGALGDYTPAGREEIDRKVASVVQAGRSLAKYARDSKSLQVQDVLAPHFEDALFTLAGEGKVDADAVASLGLRMARESAEEDKRLGDFVDGNKGKVRAARGAFGGFGGMVGGGALGALLGDLTHKPRMAQGALLGAAIGAGLAALPSPSGDFARASSAKTLRAIEALGADGAKNLAKGVISAVVIGDTGAYKASLAKEAGQILGELDKQAFLGAITKSLPSVGRAISSGGAQVGKAINMVPGAAQAGIGAGVAQGAQGIGNAVASGGLAGGARQLGTQAAGFAKKNPLAAAGLAGAGGLAVGSMMG